MSDGQHNIEGIDHGPDCLDCTPAFSALILNAVLDGNEMVAALMTSIDRLNAAVAGLVGAVADVRSTETATLKALADLSAKAAGGGKVTPAEIDAVTVQVSGLAASLSQVSTDLSSAIGTDDASLPATLYVHVGSLPFDVAAYLPADVTEPDGTALFTYAHDANGSADGASDPTQWTVYTGDTIPVATVTPAPVAEQTAPTV